ncbi:hypothetical protein [Undibacterium sp. Ji49W]|uniref:hypothetical protein n=1 Tax=Undibacterium sp. Ji49W TaxID=3413040 RepID=UPI003BF42786
MALEEARKWLLAKLNKSVLGKNAIYILVSLPLMNLSAVLSQYGVLLIHSIYNHFFV